MATKRKSYIPSDYADIFDRHTFKDHLNELIKEKDIDQQDLCGLLEVTPITITRWKSDNSKAPVPYKQIERLSRYFRVDERYLYDPSFDIVEQNRLEEAYYNHFCEEQAELEESWEETFRPTLNYLKSIGFKECYGSSPVPEGISKNGIETDLNERLVEQIRSMVEYIIFSQSERK